MVLRPDQAADEAALDRHCREQLAGSYCIKDGTEYDPGVPAVEPCEAGNAQFRCDPKFNIELNGQAVGTNQRQGSCLPTGASCENDDTCCGTPTQLACNDTVGSEDRNCNASCGSCPQGVPNPAAGCCVYGTGASEPIYDVPREDCPRSGVCGG